MKEIAARIGTSPSTISRALRNDPRISAKMRRRVLREAKKTGYVPDRTISSTMQRVRSGSSYVEAVIGLWWPGSWTEEELRTRFPSLSGTLDAIRVTAESLRLACVPRDGLPKDPRAALRIYRNRGARGFIVLPGDPEVYRVPRAFSESIVVAVGNAPQGRVQSRVTTHFADAYATIFEQLRKRGYRRPGVVVRHNARSERLYEPRYLGTYEHYCKRLRYFREVTPLRVGDPAVKGVGRELEDWLESEEPDAIVTPYASIYHALQGKARWSIPGRLGCVITGVPPEAPELSGPITDAAAVGREAVYAMLNRLHNTDAASAPDTRLLIKTTWSEGSTLPARR